MLNALSDFSRFFQTGLDCLRLRKTLRLFDTYSTMRFFQTCFRFLKMKAMVTFLSRIRTYGHSRKIAKYRIICLAFPHSEYVRKLIHTCGICLNICLVYSRLLCLVYRNRQFWKWREYREYIWQTWANTENTQVTLSTHSLYLPIFSAIGIYHHHHQRVLMSPT